MKDMYEEARAKLGLECLSVMKYVDRCAVFLHWYSERAPDYGSGKRFHEALADALRSAETRGLDMSDQPIKKPARTRGAARKHVQRVHQDAQELRKYLRESRAELDQAHQSQQLLAETCARYREQLRNADAQIAELVHADMLTRQSLKEANRRLENAQSMAREQMGKLGAERYRADRAEDRALKLFTLYGCALALFCAAVLVLL